MLKLKSTYDADMAAKERIIAELRKEVARTGVLLTKARGERDAALAELAPLKAAKAKQLSNLRNHKPAPVADAA